MNELSFLTKSKFSLALVVTSLKVIDAAEKPEPPVSQLSVVR